MKRQLRRITAVLAALAAAAGSSVTVGAAPENISAVSAIVIEADTGTALWEKNADEHRAMASTTKIMTALLTIEAGDLDREFTVDPLAILVEGTSMGLREGDRVSRRDLLYGILLPSGNDAANAAAVSVSGSIGAFVELMNSRAQELGLGTLWIANTCFAYPELETYINTTDQIISAVAVGYPDEAPGQRPRKKIEEIMVKTPFSC